MNWQLNLAALWFAVFISVTGLQFSLPFMPAYLSNDLGVQRGADLALWTGLVTGVLGLGLLIGSPIWGVLGDSFGRKLMTARATVAGAIIMALTGFAVGPSDVAVLRFLYGALSATYPMALALVVIETPRERVAWAVGLLSSSVPLATAVGPVIGGIGASLLGPRPVFFVASALYAVGTAAVLLLVRESPKRADPAHLKWNLRRFGEIPRSVAVAVTTILGTQIVATVVMTGLYTLAVLRILELAPREASIATGLAFGGSGVAAALAGAGHSRIVSRLGYRGAARTSAIGLFAGMAGLAVIGWAGPFVGLVVVCGVPLGILTPMLASMLGLEAPQAVRATILGLLSSSVALGALIGPISAGQVAAVVGPGRAFAVPGLAALLLIAITFRWLPDRRSPASQPTG